jgi:hypothetical protein
MDQKPLPHNADELRADIEGLVKESERLKAVAAANAEQGRILAQRIEETRRLMLPKGSQT